MEIRIKGVECKIIGHKYALEVKHPHIEKPFKFVVYESRDGGKRTAMPEIQLRQTVDGKQEYIMSNPNRTAEEAVEECLLKMAITEESGKDVYYVPDFDERDNRLWDSVRLPESGQ